MREAILIEAPEYFGFLLKECEPSLLALAYRITGDREAALDIVQNAYENALRALGTF
jgi:DNA-directed RNA polymerase specialized sigma24 family protein